MLRAGSGGAPLYGFLFRPSSRSDRATITTPRGRGRGEARRDRTSAQLLSRGPPRAENNRRKEKSERARGSSSSSMSSSMPPLLRPFISVSSAQAARWRRDRSKNAEASQSEGQSACRKKHRRERDEEATPPSGGDRRASESGEPPNGRMFRRFRLSFGGSSRQRPPSLVTARRIRIDSASWRAAELEAEPNRAPKASVFFLLAVLPAR